MKFKELLNLLEASRETNDAFRTTGEATSKDRAKSNAGDAKAKDAARKRAERARQTPKDKLPKTELVKQVVVVKTKDNRVQLIFKDSYNPNVHQLLSKDKALSMEEAKNATADPAFEQTRASKLLFGNVKEKPKGEVPPKKAEKEKEEPKEKGGESKAEEKEEKTEERPKAKKLSKNEMFQAMEQMSPEQLAMLPPETREEYFKKLRNPPTTGEFDNMTFEGLSVQYGLNPISSLPFNQQVLNAIVFLAKLKAGAGQQEMGTLVALSPSATDFTKKAFLQANKILSQVGDECIQNLLSRSEIGGKNIYAEGAVDMQCGDYKFKIEAGGEFSISTESFNQGNKIFKGILATSLNAALNNPQIIQSDPAVKRMMQNMDPVVKSFNKVMIPAQSMQAIMSNPKYVEQLQNTPVVDEEGNQVGTVLDEQGNLNPQASYENFQQQIIKASKSLFKKESTGESSPLLNAISTSILGAYLRGDGLKKPQEQPTHVLTANGVFPLSPDYISEISKTAIISVKKNDNPINSENLTSYNKNAGSILAKYRTIVEAKEQKTPSLKELVVDKDKINPLQMVASDLVNSYNFDFNASLIPGFSPKDLNAVEYNYVKIDNKQVKIPVVRASKIASDLVAEDAIILNDLIIEALTNNFVLSSLVQNRLIDSVEASLLQTPTVLLEQNGYDPNDILATIYHNSLERLNEDPTLLVYSLYSIQEEAARDYKKEYRNYHGKPKQRKERAARTRARELMKKKGRVRKGDGKDIDHKKPLRSGGSNGINNLRVREKSDNRSDNGHKKGEKQNKDWK
jgi:hypothetical protein